MTKDEDLKRDIEYLRKEIEKLRTETKKEKDKISKILQWLNLGETATRVYFYLKKGKTAAEIVSLASLNPVTVQSLAVYHVLQNLAKLLTRG